MVQCKIANPKKTYCIGRLPKWYNKYYKIKSQIKIKKGTLPLKRWDLHWCPQNV